PNTPQNPQTSPVLSAEFVSGHLGNYLDCPDEGYSVSADAGEQGALLAGDCAAESCGILNCETAQITFTIKNRGTVDAVGMRVDAVKLYDGDGALVAELPVMDVTDLSTSEPMDGLPADDERVFRMLYQGPAQPWDLLMTSERGYGYSATVVIELSAENHPSFFIKSPLIYVLDSVAT
ncbi:MAG: hypothetical protein R3E66_04750, partial [bacterium]